MSVVKYGDLLHPANPTVGCECRVKVAKKTYAGRLATTVVSVMLEDYLLRVVVRMYTCMTHPNIVNAGSSIEMSVLEEHFIVLKPQRSKHFVVL